MPVDPAVFDADLAPHGGPGARWPDRAPQTDGAKYLAPGDVAERRAIGAAAAPATTPTPRSAWTRGRG